MKTVKRRRRNICDEISHTEGGDMHETVTATVSMTRGLYLHALRAVRDGDYPTVSTYISDLVRRDKHYKFMSGYAVRVMDESMLDKAHLTNQSAR